MIALSGFRKVLARTIEAKPHFSSKEVRTLSDLHTQPVGTNTALKHGLAVAALIAAFLILLYALGSNVTPAPAPPAPPMKSSIPDPAQDPAAARAHVETLAKQYGNNFDRLSEEDQRFLDGLTAGHGKALLSTTVQRLRQSASQVPGRAAPGSHHAEEKTK